MKTYSGLRSKKHQQISESDIEAVVAALKSDALTQGNTVEAFEDLVSKDCGAKYALAVNSATSALHLACMGLGLNAGDTLWTTPNTFVASANCALYCGAGVDFVDISPDEYNIDVDLLSQKFERAAAEKRLPKILIPIHFAGQPARMKEIYQLAKSYGTYVVEDASHALGAVYQETRIGSCSYSDATIFSFHPVKIITTAEGGMLLTNNRDLAENVARLRTHGITRDASKMFSGSDGPWYYQQVGLGYNYRLTEIQAALGISQMKRLPQFIEKRKQIAKFYDENLRDRHLTRPKWIEGSSSSWHLYVIRLKLDQLKKSKKEIFTALWEKSVPVNVHYVPVHTQPYYQGLGFKTGDFPNSETHYQEALSLPMHCNLEEEDLAHIVKAVHEVLS